MKGRIGTDALLSFPGLPIVTAIPPDPMDSIIELITDKTPEQSTAASKFSPPVISNNFSLTSSFSGLIVWVAPNSLANFIRFSFTSTATIWLNTVGLSWATMRAAMTVAQPTAPSPKMPRLLTSISTGFTTLKIEPAPVWIPQPREQTTAKSSDLSTLTQELACATVGLQNEDCPKKELETGFPFQLMVFEPSSRWPPKFLSMISRHRKLFCFWHCRHLPQEL